MSDTMNSLLPEADFYLLYDRRESLSDLSCEHQIDRHQIYTGRLSQESDDIHSRLVERLAELFPEMPPREACMLYDERQIAFTKDMVHSESFFDTRRPKRLDHHEKLLGLSPLHPTKYSVVSMAWKNAIESVEPSVHEFFPHKLNFKDAIIEDRFIFRPRILIPDLLKPISPQNSSRQQEVKAILSRKPKVVLDPFEVVDGEPDISRFEINTALLKGHHLISASRDDIVVSKTLAARLIELLPEEFFLLPVASSIGNSGGVDE
jgi:hypothetical protein